MKHIFNLLLIIQFLSTITIATGDNKDKLGKEITLTEKTKISDILNNPEEFLDKTVLVAGPVLDVCSMMGCWIELASDVDGDRIKVKVKDGEIVFPQEAKGKNALVEGKVYKIEMTQEEAVDFYKHHAEENGEAFDPKTVTGPVTLYQIKGLGAEINKEY